MMITKPNYRLVAIEVGEALKYAVVLNDIGRMASAIFTFKKEDFPHENITSMRSQEIYNWIMTLAKQSMAIEERNQLLLKFCKQITPEELSECVESILGSVGIINHNNLSGLQEFNQRHLHAEIHQHCKQLYLDQHYFHAVFEACKAYNNLVKNKSHETKDGHDLMMSVWRPEGVLKITQCRSTTDRNVQNGIKFLSAGLMQAVRNPTAHEPAINWKISKKDCLNILSFMTFLFEKLDEAVYYES